MIIYRPGEDIFESGAEVLVNPVNCVGVMGAGLAKEFKQRYPGMYRRYVQLVLDHELDYPRPYEVTDGSQRILLLPTKKHWREKSSLPLIDQMLQRTFLGYVKEPPSSIAVPMLGCGLGGLEWGEVRPLIEGWLGSLDAMVYVYGPGPEEQE